MIPGWVLLGLLPLETLPPDDSLATVSVETLLLADPDADLILLVETAPSGGTLLRLSDVGYITGAADSPAQTPYRDRLLNAYNVETRIPTPGSSAIASELSFGVVEIEGGDEALDDLLDDSWEGRDLVVKVGGRYHVNRATQGSLTFSQFQTIQRGTINSVGWDAGRILLTLREHLQELSQPIQTNLYLGTGGLEGGAAILGRAKPLVYGRVFNFEPILVDGTKQIYQWHDGAVTGPIAVRDKGVALQSAGNVSDIVAAATPADGYYITQNSGGYIRLGALPEDGRITIDAIGATGVDDTVAACAQAMAEKVGLVAADFEAGSFSGFPDLGDVGIAITDASTSALTAISDFLAGHFAWASQSRTGLLRIGQFVDPSASVPEVTITDDVILELEEQGELPPVWRVEVSYAPNWTPQDVDALSGALSVELRELYSEPSRLAFKEDAAIQTANPDARTLRINSYLANQADAQALADAVLPIVGRRIRPIRVTVERELFRRQPGAVVRVVSSASDLATGRNYLLLNVAEDASSRLNLWELWG